MCALILLIAFVPCLAVADPEVWGLAIFDYVDRTEPASKVADDGLPFIASIILAQDDLYKDMCFYTTKSTALKRVL